MDNSEHTKKPYQQEPETFVRITKNFDRVRRGTVLVAKRDVNLLGPDIPVSFGALDKAFSGTQLQINYFDLKQGDTLLVLSVEERILDGVSYKRDLFSPSQGMKLTALDFLYGGRETPAYCYWVMCRDHHLELEWFFENFDILDIASFSSYDAYIQEHGQ